MSAAIDTKWLITWSFNSPCGIAIIECDYLRARCQQKCFKSLSIIYQKVWEITCYVWKSLHIHLNWDITIFPPHIYNCRKVFMLYFLYFYRNKCFICVHYHHHSFFPLIKCVRMWRNFFLIFYISSWAENSIDMVMQYVELVWRLLLMNCFCKKKLCKVESF